MRIRARVVRREGATARVRVCHAEYCAGCGLHSPEDEFAEVEVRDPVGATVGQHVEVESDPGRMIRVMFLVFWLPLLAAGLCAWAGAGVAPLLGLPPALVAAISGILGFVAAAAVIRRVERRTEPGTGLRVVRVVEDGPCAGGWPRPEEGGGDLGAPPAAG